MAGFVKKCPKYYLDNCLADHVPPACPTGYEARQGCWKVDCPEDLIQNPFGALIPPSPGGSSTSTVPPENRTPSNDQGDSDLTDILVGLLSFIGLILLILAISGIISRLSPGSWRWLKMRTSAGLASLLDVAWLSLPRLLQSLVDRIRGRVDDADDPTRHERGQNRSRQEANEDVGNSGWVDAADVHNRELGDTRTDFQTATSSLALRMSRSEPSENSRKMQERLDSAKERAANLAAKMRQSERSFVLDRGISTSTTDPSVMIDHYVQALDRRLTEQITSRQLYQQAGIIPASPKPSSSMSAPFDPKIASTPKSSRHVRFGATDVVPIADLTLLSTSNSNSDLSQHLQLNRSSSSSSSSSVATPDLEAGLSVSQASLEGTEANIDLFLTAAQTKVSALSEVRSGQAGVQKSTNPFESDYEDEVASLSWCNDSYAVARSKLFDRRNEVVAQLERNLSSALNEVVRQSLESTTTSPKGKSVPGKNLAKSSQKNLSAESSLNVDIGPQDVNVGLNDEAGDATVDEGGMNETVGGESVASGGQGTSHGKLPSAKTKKLKRRMSQAEAEFQKNYNLEHNPHNTRGKSKLNQLKFEQAAQDLYHLVEITQNSDQA